MRWSTLTGGGPGRPRWSRAVLPVGLALAVLSVGAATRGVSALTGGGGSPAASSSPAAATGSGDTGGTNAAVASNTKDGKTVYAISLKVVQTTSATVEPVNAAVAAASCSDCTTVAIALEGVLISGDTTTYAPVNIAVAVNDGCTNCQTLASAYQTVIQESTRVRLTGQGRRQIAALRTDLKSLRTSGLDIAAVQAARQCRCSRLRRHPPQRHRPRRPQPRLDPERRPRPVRRAGREHRVRRPEPDCVGHGHPGNRGRYAVGHRVTVSLLRQRHCVSQPLGCGHDQPDNVVVVADGRRLAHRFADAVQHLLTQALEPRDA